MKYLQILNASMLAMGAALGICMGVVCLQYAWYLESEPHLQASLPRLHAVTAAFAGLGIASLIAFVAHRRRWLLRWPAQLLPMLPLIGLILIVARMRP